MKSRQLDDLTVARQANVSCGFHPSHFSKIDHSLGDTSVQHPLRADTNHRYYQDPLRGTANGRDERNKYQQYKNND